ncbi:unnamed protein product [Ceutorhynchus assimilis]|uniref:Uncharacterized protein n=1 Tax=Ceutorhynchus assimilis TaxID=467358 RepID=A0A9N9QLW4_9CUCU|nr:unnamed protein product [Ceutorhynchus assimilis]
MLANCAHRAQLSVLLQKSEILTETPNKELLIACESKKKDRQANLEKKLEQKPSKKGKASAKHPAKNNKTVKRKVFEEEVPDCQLCDDDELDDTEVNLGDRRLVCDDWSKKDEYWFQCAICGKWAQELCSGVDSPECYICDFCDH